MLGEPDRHFAAECRIWNSLIGVYPGPCDPNTLSPRPARAIPLVVIYEVPRMRSSHAQPMREEPYTERPGDREYLLRLCTPSKALIF